MEVSDDVCTRCLRIFDLEYFMKGWISGSIETCSVCNNRNRCCFMVKRSNKWDGIDPYDRLRFANYLSSYDYYHRKPTKHLKNRDTMWRHGVELDMGILLCFVCRNIGLPTDIAKVIYGIAKQIPRRRY